ncbi:IS66 family insertion sequence element accessory protein TnpB [Xenorhabdus miraniensis]|uniref:Cytochrome o ubiquinol oxidase n=1 Tax=Xenorhabdus miraniensis TaxID=351674 RepID=A0A2D0JJK4_9GAMM|nr:IS66 family insertion sequence element accessory protein TnpB [Xenorhabdus miraniensis]PHM45575.1 cytochrome o ubiquinol oxidase [Xenorhabdus miraniensis]
MLTPKTIWLARDPVDMRQGIETLTQRAAGHLHLIREAGAAVVFCNKSRSRIKVLQWDGHGVWLCTRRLHRGHFTWPRQGETVWSLTAAQFAWLTKGIDWQQVAGLPLSGWET